MKLSHDDLEDFGDILQELEILRDETSELYSTEAVAEKLNTLVKCNIEFLRRVRKVLGHE